MGDKPAALALEIGADIAAEQGQYIDKVLRINWLMTGMLMMYSLELM